MALPTYTVSEKRNYLKNYDKLIEQCTIFDADSQLGLLESCEGLTILQTVEEPSSRYYVIEENHAKDVRIVRQMLEHISRQIREYTILHSTLISLASFEFE